jgi:leucyl/phenylalanyl-tRNA---protein transferase
MRSAVPLDPQTLLAAYAQGFFPMANQQGRISWYTANPRGIIPLDDFHVPQSLRSLWRRGPDSGGFELRINFDFEVIMRACGDNREDGTWINDELIEAYVRLHKLGFAHSVETWKDGKLAGGLYGVSLGAAFFGESMFHRARDASKVALVHLVKRLKDRNYELLDTQAVTTHLSRFGCIEIPAEEYLKKLQKALQRRCVFAD